MSETYHEIQHAYRRKVASLLLVLLCVAAVGCDTSFPGEARQMDLSGNWAFASGWIVGQISVNTTPEGTFAGQGQMTSSPLEGLWQALQHNLVLDLQNTCPILGSWQAHDRGGGLRGFAGEVGPRLRLNVRLAEPYVSPVAGPGERLAGTLVGWLSEDGRQIEGHVLEEEDRLSGGSLDNEPVLLERQATQPQYPLSLSGFRAGSQVELGFEVEGSGECRGTWHFSGTVEEQGQRLTGVLVHSIYGSYPIDLSRDS